MIGSWGLKSWNLNTDTWHLHFLTRCCKKKCTEGLNERNKLNWSNKCHFPRYIDKNSFTITTYCDSKTPIRNFRKRPKWKNILDMISGGIKNAEEKYYGLAQSNILDGVLYRNFRRYWLFDSGSDTVTDSVSEGLKTKRSQINYFGVNSTSVTLWNLNRQK